MVKILIVDDHVVFREGLKAILVKNPDFQVLGEAEDGRVAVTKAAELKPDVILMDINMPYDGLRATIEIMRKMPDIKILMLTISEKENDLHEAVKAGARGYIIKGVGVEELVASIKSVAAGAAIFTPTMAGKLLEDFSTSPKKTRDNIGLTDRETEVLRLVADGSSNKEIAAQLCVSEPTIKTHLRNILGKLHLKNRSQAAVYAAQKDWLDKPAQ